VAVTGTLEVKLAEDRLPLGPQHLAHQIQVLLHRRGLGQLVLQAGGQLQAGVRQPVAEDRQHPPLSRGKQVRRHIYILTF